MSYVNWVLGLLSHASSSNFSHNPFGKRMLSMAFHLMWFSEWTGWHMKTWTTNCRCHLVLVSDQTASRELCYWHYRRGWQSIRYQKRLQFDLQHFLQLFCCSLSFAINVSPFEQRYSQSKVYPPCCRKKDLCHLFDLRSILCSYVISRLHIVLLHRGRGRRWSLRISISNFEKAVKFCAGFPISVPAVSYKML